MRVDPMSQTTITFSIQPEVQLRFLNSGDIDEIKLLCRDWFPIDYPDSWFQDIASNAKFYSLASVYNGKIIGLIVSEVKTRSKCNKEDADILSGSYPNTVQVAYILSLGVAQEYRRHGIASLLLDNLLNHLTRNESVNCKAVYLHVLTTNVAAIRFYEHRHFIHHSYLPYYYSIKGQPRDGYTYVLYINGGQPPWSLLDLFKQVGTFVSKLQPCRLPLKLLRCVHHIWKMATTTTSRVTITNHSS
ncbi:N-alpha-acetyltransferase 60-like [Tubulanus polymorphus]|uniref:N-alpha-acetyltransferase 60-like n=1 Tax=Tubulanus polymorphus TaxID=672921 RepID=UPI003DA25B17